MQFENKQQLAKNKVDQSTWTFAEIHEKILEKNV